MVGLVLLVVLLLVGGIPAYNDYRVNKNLQPILVLIVTLMVYTVLVPIGTMCILGKILVLDIEVSQKKLMSFYSLLSLSVLSIYGGWYSIRQGFKYNLLFLKKHSSLNGVSLIVLGCLGYFLVHDFTLINDGNFKESGSSAFDEYFVNLVSLLILGVALLFKFDTKFNRWVFYLSLFFVVTVFISSGFRYRILMLTLVLITYAGPAFSYKIEIRHALILGSILFLLFGLMAATRSYSNGLNKNKFNKLNTNELVTSALFETEVFGFSAIVYDNLKLTGQRVGLEPVFTALLMPIPRSILPSKPNANYLRELQKDILGTDKIGMAFLYCVEGFLMFGYIGVVFQGFILGLLMRLVWNSVRVSKAKEGYLILGLFNGLTYFYVSRGYLPVMGTAVTFYILLPLAIARLVHIIRLR